AGPERDHRDEVAVHDIHVEGSRAGVEQFAHRRAERAEVGRQDGRADLDVGEPRARSLHAGQYRGSSEPSGWHTHGVYPAAMRRAPVAAILVLAIAPAASAA